MSTAAVSTASLYTQTQEYFQTRQSDLKQLGNDLSTGDTTDAATEYQDIVQLGQNGPFASGNAFSRNDRQSDFTAIGSALQSGNTAGAQQAYANLQATFQRPVQDPVTQNPVATPILSTAPPATTTGSGSGPEITLNIAAPTSGSGPEQINITIGTSSSGGEQLSIGVGSVGSNSQQVTTLNLPSNSDEQIVLNLLGPAATPAASTSTSTAASTTAATTPAAAAAASTGSNLSVTA